MSGCSWWSQGGKAIGISEMGGEEVEALEGKESCATPRSREEATEHVAASVTSCPTTSL